MQCDPKNEILPANRAMVYLKTESWRQADTDCSLAILLDDGYVKAYQRRATARKELKDYAKALEDLNHVLLLEPNNKSPKLENWLFSRLKRKDQNLRKKIHCLLPTVKNQKLRVCLFQSQDCSLHS